MLKKKMVIQKARTLRQLGIPFPAAKKIARKYVSKSLTFYNLREILEPYGIFFQVTVDGYCPSDGDPYGRILFPKGFLDYACYGIIIPS